jgi:hypothetical protein
MTFRITSIGVFSLLVPSWHTAQAADAPSDVRPNIIVVMGIERVRRGIMTGGASLDTRLAKFVLKTLKAKLPSNEIDHLLSKREPD